MNGILEITLNGKKERLRINNYAREVLRRYFAGDKHYLTNGELMQAFIDTWEKNETLLLKKIVYAGIVGDSLVSNDKPRLTETEVGEYIGDADPSELLRIWKVFLDAMGLNLSPEGTEEQEEEPKETTLEDEKKKMKKT